jgi:hypothetical protein
MEFGLVENINDPLKLGRVKVRVFGRHDIREGTQYNINTKDLPWSQVVMPATTPAINGTGHSVNLAIGSLVCGVFLDISAQEFIVMGSLPTKTEGIEDNNVRVRAEADPHAAETRGTYQPASTYAPEYPYNNVMETESGHVKEYDDTPGLERITERHKSGTNYEITANGSKNETIVRDNYRLVIGQDTLEVYGDVRIIVSGHCDLAVAGNVTTAIGGDMLSTVDGNITLKNTDAVNKRIILDGNAIVKGNLVVNQTTTTSAESSTRSAVVLDTHAHTHDGSNWTQNGNTSEPN